MPDALYEVSATFAVDGRPSARQLASLFRLVDEAVVRAWLVENERPLHDPPRRPRLVARNALLRDAEFPRIVYVQLGSPIEVRQIVRGGKRAAVVVAATAATLGGTFAAVSEALDQVSGTVERVERIYEQIRDFGEEDSVQGEESVVLQGRESEPRIRLDRMRVRQASEEWRP